MLRADRAYHTETRVRDSAATPDRLVRFLLGELSREEREAIERACLVEDASLFAELIALEQELRLALAGGGSLAGDRDDVETLYRGMASDRARLRLKRALVRLAVTRPRTPSGA